MMRRPAGCLAFGAMVVLGGCFRKSDAGADEKVQPVVAAAVAPATAQPFVETVNAIGTVQAQA
ncbi:MAG: hypothetical protein ACREK8_03600, partial [Gemmatimonadales bacterium]